MNRKTQSRILNNNGTRTVARVFVAMLYEYYYQTTYVQDSE